MKYGSKHAKRLIAPRASFAAQCVKGRASRFFLVGCLCVPLVARAQDEARGLPSPALRAGGALLVAQADPTPAQNTSPPPHPSPSPPAEPSTPSVSKPYVDQVLDDSPLQITPVGVTGAPQVEPEGRRYFTADYKLYTRDASGAGRSLEQGMALRYRRETLNYGELYFEGELRNYQPADLDTLPARTLSSRYTLSQYKYALTERLQMDNALGYVRSSQSPLIGSSFRIQLPTSVMRGVTSVIYDQQQEWRFSTGQLARLSGVATQQLDVTQGTLSSVGYTRRLDGNWTASAQLNSVAGSDVVRDHQSGALALQYWSPDRRNRYQLHGITDSKGRSGMWFDADQRSGALQNRYGIFRIEPDVLWTDTLILNDQQGGYWRSDYRTPRYTLAGGADYTDNNIRNDATRAGSRIGSAFVTGFWRYDRTLSFNANANINHSQPKIAVPGIASTTTTTVNAAAAKTLDWGVTRVQLTHTQADSALAPAREDTLRWDHDWALTSTRQLSTTLSQSWAQRTGIDSTRSTVGMLLRHYVSAAFRWDGNVTYTRLRDATGLTDNNLNASINGYWSINRNWSAQAQFIWNRVDNTNPLAPVLTRDKTLLLLLRYEASSGRPLTRQGLATGSLGSGRVSGRVFFDENGDGVRQATERPAAGLIVLLDGRYRAMTDNDGRFEFGPVPTGTHDITVQVERLPLPWGLLDERARRASVPLRGEVVVDIPLSKLNQ